MTAHELARKLLEGPDLPVFGDPPKLISSIEVIPPGDEQLRLLWNPDADDGEADCPNGAVVIG